MQFHKHLIKLMNEFFSKWRYWGFALAIYNLIWWLCFYLRPPFALKVSAWALKRKTLIFDNYFNKKYADVINQYKRNLISTPVNSICIWVFWGQGEENMPPLVKACYRQLTHFNDNVILITNKNIEDYVILNPLIYSKVKEGYISWANFSDIVRTTLLSKYGGLWVDATVWIPQKIPFQILSNFDIFSPNGRVSQTNRSVQFWTSYEWNWSTWYLWSKNAHNKLFLFISSMLQAIGEREKCWPDYVIQDYLIYYACRFFPDVQKSMEKIQGISGKRRNDFASIMNQSFDIIQYTDLTSSDFAFKLSFRSHWKTKTSSGIETFYGRILNGIIDSNK